eukprot:5553386-Pleurochrysis_carterae.AAC.2
MCCSAAAQLPAPSPSSRHAFAFAPQLVSSHSSLTVFPSSSLNAAEVGAGHLGDTSLHDCVSASAAATMVRW